MNSQPDFSMLLFRKICVPWSRWLWTNTACRDSHSFSLLHTYHWKEGREVSAHGWPGL